jgi:hypothetical protein
MMKRLAVVANIAVCIIGGAAATALLVFWIVGLSRAGW